VSKSGHSGDNLICQNGRAISFLTILGDVAKVGSVVNGQW